MIKLNKVEADALVIPSMVTEEYRKKIDNGMAFLDDYFGTPEWVNEIDLKSLDLSTSDSCVCGQLFDPKGNKLHSGHTEGLRPKSTFPMEGYEYALRHVIEHGTGNRLEGEKSAYEMGFILPRLDDLFEEKGLVDEDGLPIDIEDYILVENGYNPNQYYATSLTWKLLTKMWEQAIEKRRAELGTNA